MTSDHAFLPMATTLLRAGSVQSAQPAKPLNRLRINSIKEEHVHYESRMFKLLGLLASTRICDKRKP